MPVEEAKIFGWLPRVEGKCTSIGYIPCYVKGVKGKKRNYYGARTGDPDAYDPMGVSGVTVGVGVDLGQQSVSQLLHWGVSEALMEKLRPYIGLKDAAAARALYRKPLVLSEDEARALTNAEHHGYMADVVEPGWNYRFGKRGGQYAGLPWQAQCVVFSLVYQHGWGGALKRGEHTLDALAARDWPRAVRNLRSGVRGWGSDYWRRRMQEGDLLAEIC